MLGGRCGMKCTGSISSAVVLVHKPRALVQRASRVTRLLVPVLLAASVISIPPVRPHVQSLKDDRQTVHSEFTLSHSCFQFFSSRTWQLHNTPLRRVKQIWQRRNEDGKGVNGGECGARKINTVQRGMRRRHNVGPSQSTRNHIDWQSPFYNFLQLYLMCFFLSRDFEIMRRESPWIITSR